MKRLSTVLAILSLPAVAMASDFKVEAAAFADGRLKPAQFAAGMGCIGGNVWPVIRWSGAPEGTRSFVVTLRRRLQEEGSVSGRSSPISA